MQRVWQLTLLLMVVACSKSGGQPPSQPGDNSPAEAEKSEDSQTQNQTHTPTSLPPDIVKTETQASFPVSAPEGDFHSPQSLVKIFKENDLICMGSRHKRDDTTKYAHAILNYLPELRANPQLNAVIFLEVSHHINSELQDYIQNNDKALSFGELEQLEVKRSGHDMLPEAFTFLDMILKSDIYKEVKDRVHFVALDEFMMTQDVFVKMAEEHGLTREQAIRKAVETELPNVSDPIPNRDKKMAARVKAELKKYPVYKAFFNFGAMHCLKSNVYVLAFSKEVIYIQQPLFSRLVFSFGNNWTNGWSLYGKRVFSFGRIDNDDSDEAYKLNRELRNKDSDFLVFSEKFGEKKVDDYLGSEAIFYGSNHSELSLKNLYDGIIVAD